MNLREAAEMALEACEHLHRTGDTQVFDLCYADKVIPALRQALAQPVDAINMSEERVYETAKGEHEQKTPLKVLNLTVFTENRLRNGRVYDVETLQGMTNRDILAIPDIGKKALAEVLEALAKLKEQNRG